MKDLTIFKHDNTEVVDSREVAKMIDRPHNDLMKSIRSYCEYLGQGDFSQSDFFIQSTYSNNQNKEQPCYLLTKKGCDMVANKMTGEKGVLFTAAYVTAFESMREHVQKGTPLPDSSKQAISEAKLNNSRARVSSMWLKIASVVSIPEYKDICASFASTALAGKEVLPLPDCKEHLYTATEIGNMLVG